MSRLIWIDAVYKSLLLSPMAVKELIAFAVVLRLEFDDIVFEMTDSRL